MGKRRHSGRDAGIQRPMMVNLEYQQILNKVPVQPASYRPWHWIPAFHAGMTLVEASYSLMLRSLRPENRSGSLMVSVIRPKGMAKEPRRGSSH
jgi:hypothetical protein